MTGTYRALVGIKRCCHRWKNLQSASSTTVLVKKQSFHSVQTLSASSGRSGKDKRGRKDKNGLGAEIHNVELRRKDGGYGGKSGRSGDSGMVCPLCNSPYQFLQLFEGNPKFIKCCNCSSLFEQVVEDTKIVKTPKELKERLDQVVIGQDAAKIALSSAVYEHYKRVKHNKVAQSAVDLSMRDTRKSDFHGRSNSFTKFSEGIFNPDEQPSTQGNSSPGTPFSDVKLQKSNILMLGPTGTGKTYLVSTLANYLDVPFVEFDCTALTAYGYVGEDVNTIISKLYQEADCDIDKCQKGIILLDEIDKIAKKRVGMSNKDVGGESVQQALLKMLEGTKVEISSKGTKMSTPGKTTVIDTTNILIIGAGAFSNLDQYIKKRQHKKYLGFGAPVSSDTEPAQITDIADLFRKPSDKEEAIARDNAFRDVQDIDLIKYGFLPEFVGRISKFVVTHSLDEEALRRILTEPKNALVKQFQCLFGFEKCDLEFTEGALHAIVKNAMKKRTGARGLKGEIDKILFMPMYDVPGSDITTVIIDEDCVTKNAAPVYKRSSLGTMNCVEEEEDDGTSSTENTSSIDTEKGGLVSRKAFTLSPEFKGFLKPEK